MTNAELIKALRYCAEHEGCDYYIAKDCPREDTWVCGADCEQILMIDAADALEAAEKRIAELMPKEGEWIVTTEVSDDGAVTSHINCSRCGFYWREPKHGKVFKRCPNCGAKMKGEQE